MRSRLTCSFLLTKYKQMADNLGRGRKLPPLSPKGVSSEHENEHSDTPRKRKKKKAPSKSDVTSVEDETPRKTSARKMRPDSARTNNSEISDREHVKVKKKPVGSSREALVSDPEVMSDRSNVAKKKKKKPRKATKERNDEEEYGGDLGLAAELGDLHEDIVIAEEKEKTTPQWTGAPTMRSEPASKVFIEKPSGFKTTDKSKLARKRAEQQKQVLATPTAPPDYNTMQVAFGSHKVFKTLTLFLQGLFAGIALWHIVAVWTLSNNGSDVFLEYYYNLALPVACMYYFLFAVTIVAVFDRYDIGRPTRRLFVRCCTMQSGMVSCLIYLIGLVFSLAIANIDDKIGLYKYDDTLWPPGSGTDDELRTWRILNLMRGIMAMLGWFVISLRPNTDRLTKNLQQDDDLFFQEISDQIDGIGGDELKANGV